MPVKEEAQEKPQAPEPPPRRSAKAAAAEVEPVPAPMTQANIEALEAAVVKQEEIALAVKDEAAASAEAAAADTFVTATEARDELLHYRTKPLESATGQDGKKEGATPPMPESGSCCVIA